MTNDPDSTIIFLKQGLKEDTNPFKKAFKKRIRKDRKG